MALEMVLRNKIINMEASSQFNKLNVIAFIIFTYWVLNFLDMLKIPCRLLFMFLNNRKKSMTCFKCR